MQLKLVKEICINFMLIQLQLMGMLMEFFQIFLAIVHHSYDPLHMVWISKLHFVVEYLGLQFLSCTYMVHNRDVLIGCLSCDPSLDWLNVVKVVKQ
jgi:hypothetical protein